jgi:hypothetical protein
MAKNNFEEVVLTHLKYIKEKIEEQSREMLEFKSDYKNQVKECDKRFFYVNKDINVSKGFAKGALAVGTAGLGTGVLGWIARFFGAR